MKVYEEVRDIFKFYGRGGVVLVVITLFLGFIVGSLF